MKQRGMVKWQPFASLPEQAGYIQQVLYDLNKIEKPLLSEDQLLELNRLVYEAYESRAWIKLAYFYDGYIYLVEGVIIKIELDKQTIVVEHHQSKSRFAIKSIIDLQIG